MKINLHIIKSILFGLSKDLVHKGFDKLSLTALFIFSFTSLFAQKFPKKEIELDEFIQKVAATQQNDVNYEDVYENLYQLYQSPIELNSATAEDLRNLYLLSEAQINNFLAYRKTFGNFLSIYELQAVPLFDIATIRLIAPFITLSNNLNINDITGIFRRATDHYLLIRADQTLEPSRGFTDSVYAGSRQRIYTRYRMQHSQDFSIGFVSEKDAGETSLLDYYTFHAQLQNKGNFKNIIVGDYQASFGQGLVYGAGYFVGKGGEPIYTVRRSAVGLRPYNSLIEGGFFRGGAITYQFKKIEFTALASRHKRDASTTASASDLEPEEVISSLLTSGIHRTENEIANKNAITEQNLGMALVYRLKTGKIGITGLYTQFDKSIEREPRPYNFYEFRGNTNSIIGIDFSKTWQNVNFFGEIARSASGGVGAVGGWVASLSPKVEWAMNFRKYDKDFHSFYGNSFAENSRPINEQGIYSGLKFTPRKGIIFSAFYDRFAFPWLKYQVDAPSLGYDYLFRFTYQPTKRWAFYMQFHNEIKQRNLPNNESATNVLADADRKNLLANFDFTPSRKFKLQSRVQYNSYAYKGYSISNGFALLQDIEGIIGKWQLKGRIAYYQTDDYNSRIYAYENDVLYAVSFPAYYGKGVRLYLVNRYPITKKLDVWLRIARTNRLDNYTIGSGYDALGVPYRTDLKVQARYKL